LNIEAHKTTTTATDVLNANPRLEAPAKHIPTDNNHRLPTTSMYIIDMILPGKFAKANMKVAAYGFPIPTSSKRVDIHVDMP
jgi:hypothetical protein